MAADGPSFELSDVFEDMVDWPKRLAGEEGFYRRLFGDVGRHYLADDPFNVEDLHQLFVDARHAGDVAAEPGPRRRR